MKKWILALMAGTALVPAGAHAADTAVGADDATTQTQTDDGVVGDIVVTAQRYEQRLQDVPLSISVLGKDELESRNVGSLSELQYAVSGLSLFEYGPGKEYIQMRGLATISGAATVGVYLDETPIASEITGASLSVRMLDIERVEVLRGPQATLYGDSSMGGTIRYIPAAPKFDTVSGSAEVEYNGTKGGSAGYKAVGVINLPLGENAAVRLVGGYERIGGYIDNVTTGENNVNTTDLYTIRGTLLAKPNDRLTISLMGLYQRSIQDNQDFGIDYVTNVPSKLYNRNRYTLIQGKVDYELDFANLALTVSHIDNINATLSDISGSYAPAVSLYLGYPSGYVTEVSLVSNARYKTFYTEARLSSQGDSALGWQVGANYRNLKFTVLATAPTAPNTLPVSLLDYSYDDDIDYMSVYGELYYAITPKLKATGGLRYFREKKREDIIATNFGVSTTDIGRGVFQTLNPRFNLSYEISGDSMVYANVAKGFRGGGFNSLSAGLGIYDIPPTYAPDKIWTYELGTKHALLGNKLTLDASVYRSYWTDVQSYAFVPGGTITVTNNAGDVRGWGVDLALTARPIRDLTLSATYGWNNMKFSKATADKNKGDPVDGAVRESWSASADFRPPLAEDIAGIFRVDYQHAGNAQITLRNFGGQIVPRPGRDLVNLRIGASFGPLEVTAFAENLFDVNTPNIVGPYGVFLENLEQRPRVIGVNARMNF